MRRVVVTGMGIASPLGSTVETAFERLKTYQNCIEYWTELDEIKNMNTRLCAKVAGFQKPEHFTRKVTRTMGTVALMSAVISENAIKDANLLGNPIITNGRCGVSYGSSTGSMKPIFYFYAIEL